MLKSLTSTHQQRSHTTTYNINSASLASKSTEQSLEAESLSHDSKSSSLAAMDDPHAGGNYSFDTELDSEARSENNSNWTNLNIDLVTSPSVVWHSYIMQASDHAGFVFPGHSETLWDKLLQQEAAGEPYAPWKSKAEWELAHWLSMSQLSQSDINNFLQLKWVSRLHSAMTIFWTRTYMKGSGTKPSHLTKLFMCGGDV